MTAEDIKLQVKLRKSGDQKEDQMIPGILYGKGTENIMVWVESLNFERIYDEAGESTLIDLEVSNSKQGPHKVLIYDTQSDPISGEKRHVDFYRVRMDEEIETDVELTFIGESPAVKELGGILIKNIDSVKVHCLPADLPKKLQVDISALKTFEDRFCVKDLEVSDKVQIDLDPKTAISVVNPPRSEEELEELDKEIEGDISQVEGMEEKVEEGEESEGEGEGEGKGEGEGEGEGSDSAEASSDKEGEKEEAPTKEKPAEK